MAPAITQVLRVGGIKIMIATMKNTAIIAGAASLLLLTACSGGGEEKTAAPETNPTPGTEETEIALSDHAASQDDGDWSSQGASVIQDRSHHSEAEALFVEKCSMCHRDLGMGTVLLSRRMDPSLAKLEDRNDLNADYIKSAARHGIGNMPPIQPGEVSDEQLDIIANYLTKSE